MRAHEFTLFDDFNLHGNWWVRRRPAQKVRGTLSFKHDGDLTLFLGGRLTSPATHTRKSQALYGHTDDGDDCSVFPVFEVKSHLTHTGVTTTDLIAQYLLLGGHATSLESLKVPTVSVRFTNLEYWINQPGIYVTHGSRDEGAITKAEVKSLPQAIDVRVDAMSATVYSGSAFSFSGGGHRIEWRQSDWLSITADVPMKGSWFLDKVYSLQRLLTLLVFAPVWPVEIILKPLRGNELIIFPAQMGPTTRSDKILMPHQMFTTLADVRDQIGDVLAKWFSLEKAFSPTVNLLVGTMFRPNVFVEFQFLSLMQALESFHSRARGGTYLPAKSYAKLYERIVRKLPDDMPKPLRERLKNTLKFGNEFSLRKRFEDVLASLPKELRAAVSPGGLGWAVRAVATRNYYTHYSDELERDAFAIEDVMHAVTRLRVLLVVLLLKELGLSDDKVTRLIERNYKLSGALG